MKKLKDITVTVAQLKKLVNVLPTNLPDDKTFTSQELKSLARRGVYARVLADMLCYAGSKDDETGIYIPYDYEGILETDWDSDPLITDPKVAKLLITMNKFVKHLGTWYTNDYYGEQELPIEQSFDNFNDLIQDAHDWVISRLRKADVLPDSEFDKQNVPLFQEDGYSFFAKSGNATIAPSK